LPLLALACKSNPEQQCSGLLDFNLTLLIQLGIFIVTATLLWFLVWKPIVGVIEDRERRIAEGTRAGAMTEEQLSHVVAEVERMLGEARERARTTVGEARRAAVAEAEAARFDARRQAGEIVGGALAEIAAERQAALRQLREQTVDLVVAVTLRLGPGVAVDNTAVSAVLGS